MGAGQQRKLMRMKLQGLKSHSPDDLPNFQLKRTFYEVHVDQEIYNSLLNFYKDHDANSENDLYVQDGKFMFRFPNSFIFQESWQYLLRTTETQNKSNVSTVFNLPIKDTGRILIAHCQRIVDIQGGNIYRLDFHRKCEKCSEIYVGVSKPIINDGITTWEPVGSKGEKEEMTYVCSNESCQNDMEDYSEYYLFNMKQTFYQWNDQVKLPGLKI